MEGDSSVGEVMKENEWAQNIQKSWYIDQQSDQPDRKSVV